MERILKYIDVENPYTAVARMIFSYVGGAWYIMFHNEPILGSLGGGMVVSALLAASTYFGHKGAKMLDKFVTEKWKLYKSKIKKS